MSQCCSKSQQRYINAAQGSSQDKQTKAKFRHMTGRTHIPRSPCPHKVLTNICFGKATFLLSISYLGNRLPLCLPRSWQAQLTLLFCLPDFLSCTPDFLHLDFCYFSIFWGYFLLAIAFVLTLETFVIFLSMAQRSRLKRLQRLKVSLKLFLAAG